MLITIIDLYTFDHLTPKFSVNQIQQYIISDWLFVHHVINFNKSGFIISVKSSCTMRLTSFSLHDLPTPLYINIRHQIEDIFKLRMSTTKKQEFLSQLFAVCSTFFLYLLPSYCLASCIPLTQRNKNTPVNHSSINNLH